MQDNNLEVHLLRQLDHPNARLLPVAARHEVSCAPGRGISQVVRYFTSFITGAGPASTLWRLGGLLSHTLLRATTRTIKTITIAGNSRNPFSLIMIVAVKVAQTRLVPQS